MADLPLICPRCALGHPLEDRFCRQCGLPLVYAGGQDEKPITGQQERARKIRPEYAQGELVRVAGARNQAEAELVQGILLEEGIPSVVRRTRGFDVPDFLAAGPRDVMVPTSAAETAGELLRATAPDTGAEPLVPAPEPAAKLLLWITVSAGAVAVMVWLIVETGS